MHVLRYTSSFPMVLWPWNLQIFFHSFSWHRVSYIYININGQISEIIPYFHDYIKCQTQLPIGILTSTTRFQQAPESNKQIIIKPLFLYLTSTNIVWDLLTKKRPSVGWVGGWGGGITLTFRCGVILTDKRRYGEIAYPATLIKCYGTNT